MLLHFLQGYSWMERQIWEDTLSHAAGIFHGLSPAEQHFAGFSFLLSRTAHFVSKSGCCCCEFPSGLGCATTMPHASLVPFQVFTAVLVALFFLFFVAVEWLVVRCMLTGSANDNTDYSTLPKYIRWKEYNLSVGEYLCTFSVNFYLFALLSHRHLSFIQD